MHVRIKNSCVSIILVLAVFLLTSCSGVSEEPAEIIPSSSPASQAETSAICTESESSSASSAHSDTGEPTDEEFDVLFVGNSLTDGIIPSKFQALAGYANKSVNIFQLLGSGRKLSQHLITLKELSSRKTGSSLTLFDKADIVILQEHITDDIDTIETVAEIQKLFDADTKFYYLLTEFDIPRVDELKEMQNISFIPCGYVHALLLESGFSYAQLHMLNDFHPNSLYGYASALTVYSVIYDADCTGMSYDFLDAQTIELIPGSTSAEKDRTVLKIQELVMRAVNMRIGD